MKLMPVTRALISVSDKSGILEFAKKLSQMGIEILSTGGTSKTLKDNNIPVVSVDSYTGHPEIMDGRVKTLHPRVHGGILAIRENPTHIEQMNKNGIKPIDLVVVNLYPFQKTVANPDVSIEDAIENIDIGGPTMVRSSAKNHAYVTIVVDPSDYDVILDELTKAGGISFETRKRLAVKAFRHTADYDAAIDKFLSRVYLDEEILRLSYNKGEKLSSGENSHRMATFFKKMSVDECSVSRAVQIFGDELSYNDVAGADTALELIKEVSDFPAVAVIKNNDLCGFATGINLENALYAAWNDNCSGSIVAFSGVFSLESAKAMADKQVEVLIAPDFAPDAIEYLKKIGSAARVLATGELKHGTTVETENLRQVTGGLLWQTRDKRVFKKSKSVTVATFAREKEKLANFTMNSARNLKSGAIVLAQEYETGCFKIMGTGLGQSDSKKAFKMLALPETVDNLKKQYQNLGKGLPQSGLFDEMAGMVLASDLPLIDPEIVSEAFNAGIRYIVQPGGSKFDSDIIAICDRLGVSMIVRGQ
ncbi:MAG TPA: bifunctional phosphoribosylaminoimidazolecarboxamide formyltransferase/IMP cyclohydrolase [Chitinispirillaceae bacterium]|nr:bifunctional phosphoribosylaminoimidazolecarboxamide formyltransferase/IMP cyclohydrolase [Chitinispirillaceae bacterium]